VLAAQLEEAHQSFVIFDGNHPRAASMHAAGIIQPLSGRRYAMITDYQNLISECKNVYGRFSKNLGRPYLMSKDIILRLHTAKEENDFWSQAQRYNVDASISAPEIEVTPLRKTGHRLVGYPGYRLDIAALIKDHKEKWSLQGKLRKEIFEYDEVVIHSNRIRYKGLESKCLIFCEGVFVQQNPFFSSVPIIPNKGQYLWIETPGWQNENVYKDHILLSGHGEKQWLGSTYEWSFDSELPDSKGFAKLTTELNQLIHMPYQVLSHNAGLRPTTKDRRPIIRSHELYKNIWCVNGLGTKGALWAPSLMKKAIHQILMSHSLG
jgi:glycine oxidase